MRVASSGIGSDAPSLLEGTLGRLMQLFLAGRAAADEHPIGSPLGGEVDDAFERAPQGRADDASDRAPQGWARTHPLAAYLEGLTPGVELAALVASIEPADVDDAALLEAAAAWERVMSWAAARQADVISELRRRREAQRCDNFLGDELSARLGTTRAVGESKVGLAIALERLPGVAAALVRGDLDLRKTVVVTEELMHLPDDVAAAASDAVLPDAHVLTAPQLRAKLRRLEINRDPDGAHNRHERARADRYVSISPTQDAMAWLTALLPAPDAVAVYTTLTALADAADPADDRSMGARRADALVDLATRYLDAGATPDGPLPTRHRRYPHLNITASAATLLGLDSEPAELAGYGPIPAPMARAIADRATWRPLLVDARSGEPIARATRAYRPSNELTGAILDRDRECTFPGCRVIAVRCDLDHIEPFDNTRPAGDQTTADNLQPLCRHHHLVKTHGGWALARDPATGVTTWQSPTGHRYVRDPARCRPGAPDQAVAEGPSPPLPTGPTVSP